MEVTVLIGTVTGSPRENCGCWTKKNEVLMWVHRQKWWFHPWKCPFYPWKLTFHQQNGENVVFCLTFTIKTCTLIPLWMVAKSCTSRWSTSHTIIPLTKNTIFHSNPNIVSLVQFCAHPQCHRHPMGKPMGFPQRKQPVLQAQVASANLDGESIDSYGKQ